MLSAMRRMGISKDETSGHGFRAMARTELDEVLHVRPDYIEHQLAHLPERRKMMQDWARLSRCVAGRKIGLMEWHGTQRP